MFEIIPVNGLYWRAYISFKTSYCQAKRECEKHFPTWMEALCVLCNLCAFTFHPYLWKAIKFVTVPVLDTFYTSDQITVITSMYYVSIWGAMHWIMNNEVILKKCKSISCFWVWSLLSCNCNIRFIRQSVKMYIKFLCRSMSVVGKRVIPVSTEKKCRTYARNRHVLIVQHSDGPLCWRHYLLYR